MASEITGLSVKVSAAVSQFNAGMSRAQDAASDLSLSLRRLGAASESADRDIDALGRSALGASGGMLTFGASTEGAGFAVRGLSASIIVALVPALVTLTAALAPVLAALGGLATIGAAIGGIGLVGVIGAIATNTEMLRESFNSVVATIRDEFAPVFDLAAAVLDILLREFEQIIPQLVPAQTVLEQLAGNFLELGSAIIDALPALVELATTLAAEFLPPFVQFVDDVLPQAPDMLETLVDITRDVLPIFMAFGESVMNLLGPLNEFGMEALPLIAEALGTVNGFIIDTLEFVNDLENGLTSLVAGGSLVLPFLVGLVSLLGGPVTLALAGVVAAVAGFARAFRTNFANIRGYLTGLWRQFRRVFDALLIAFDAFVSGIDFDAITAAVGRFENALGTQLMQTLNALRPVFSKFTATMRENKDEFRIIGQFASNLITTFLNVSTAVIDTLYPAIRTLLVPALELAVDALGVAIDLFAGVITTARDFEEFFGTLPTLLAQGFAQMLVLGSQWANSFKNLFIDVWNFIIGGFGRAFNSILDRIATGINGVISVINQAIQSIPWRLVPGMDGPDQLAQIDAPQIDTAAGQFERAQTDRGVIRERVVERIGTITVENGEIVAKMEDTADGVVDNRVEAVDRDTRRNQGRGTSL